MPTYAGSSVASLAARFLEFGEANQQPISNLKLQKLVALAQSLHVYATGEAAFSEAVQAWDNGPAVKPLYGRYKHFGSAPIQGIDRSGTGELDDRHERVVAEVWSVVGHLSAGALWKMTHDVGPWPRHYVPEIRDIELPVSELGAAWPTYLAKAYELTQYRTPANSAVIGHGQRGFRTDNDYREALGNFTPSSAARHGG